MACQSVGVEVVVVRSCRMRRCCAAGAAMSEDLLNDKPGMVGFRVLFVISLNWYQKNNKARHNATGTLTTGQFYWTWQGHAQDHLPLLTVGRDLPT